MVSTAENLATTLIFAAHPDDEVLGCGGAIAKLDSAGAEVHLAFLADGATSNCNLWTMALPIAATPAFRRTASLSF